MKKFNSRNFLKYILVVGTLMISLNVLAQDEPPPDLGGDPGAPLDGGVSILIAAGVGYGVKKMRDHNKRKTSDD